MKISFSQTENQYAPQRHCQTCNCENQSEFFQWKREKKVINSRIQPITQNFQSRIQERRGPVGGIRESRISQDKMCWYRSQSPRRPNIKIKISTPQSPNLFSAGQPPIQRSRIINHNRIRSEMPRSIISPTKLTESMSTMMTPNKNLWSAERNQQSLIYTEQSEKSDRDHLRWSQHNGYVRNFGNLNGFYQS